MAAGAILSAVFGAKGTDPDAIHAAINADPEAALKLQLAELQFQQQQSTEQAGADTAQVAVNQAEASSGNLFNSGWRPFVGWCCAVAFAWAYVIEPVTVFVLVAAHVPFDVSRLPVLDITTMVTVLLGLLGLGTLRTAEKIKGVAS
jgi:hypothetical protein